MSPDTRGLLEAAKVNGVASLTKRKAVAELISLGLAEKRNKALYLTPAGQFAAGSGSDV